MIALLLATAMAAESMDVPDRSGPPVVVPSAPIDLPEPTVHELRPGIRVHWLQVPGVRRVDVTLILQRGHLHLDGKTSPAGDMLSSIWDSGTDSLDPEALETALGDLDAGVSADVAHRQSTVSLSVPADGLSPALDLLEDVLRHPSLAQREIKHTARDTQLYFALSAPNSPGAVASAASRYAIYPADHPYGERPDPAALAKVKRKDVLARHARLLAESPIDVLVVGDITWDAWKDRFTALVEGLGADGPMAPPLPARPPGSMRVLAVDMPSADQTQIIVRTAAPPDTAPDAPVFASIQHAIGGHFLARLNKNLREDKGWTYGGYSRYIASHVEGSWVYSVEVAEQNVGPALVEIQRELDTMAAGGVSAEEQATFATSVVTGWNETLGTADSAAGRYLSLLVEDETLADGRAWLEATRAVDPAATAAVASRWLTGDDRIVVLVGDRAAIEPAVVEVLGTAIEWITPVDAIFGRFGSTPTP